MSSTVALILLVVTLELTAARHMHGWHHDLAEKKKQQPVTHPGFKQLGALSKAVLSAGEPNGVILPPDSYGRSIASSDEIQSETGRRGFARQDILTNRHNSDNYNHKAYARGGTLVDKASAAVIGGPFSQGDREEMFRVKADSGSSVVQGIQRSDEVVKDYEAELNRDYSKSRISQLTDLGVVDPRSAGAMMDWKNEGIDNVAVKTNQISSIHRAKEKTVDVVNDREHGAGNAEAAKVIAVPV